MDPMTLAAAAAAATGALNFVGQERANRENKDIWRKSQAWQEQMSNTAWQRGVADMKAAGVNPMLMVSQGGASSPGASVGAPMQNVFKGAGEGISSAVQLAMLKKQLELLDSQVIQNKANAAKSTVDAANAASETPVRQAIGQAASSGISTAKSLQDTIGRLVGGTVFNLLHPSQVINSVNEVLKSKAAPFIRR